MCSGSVVQGSSKDVADVEDAEDAVAGRSTDDVASVAVAASQGSRPKRSLKLRSIFDHSHVSKKKPLAIASPLRPSSPRHSQPLVHLLRFILRVSQQLHLHHLIPLSVDNVTLVPPPLRRRKALLQPEEEMIVEILPDISPATAITRRPYESDGRREETFVEPDESTMESSFEDPTQPSYMIYEEGTNKWTPEAY
ncbi:hypothetical protein OUZ56_012593 [Daphnia magna]|uniref:Uncharacterized protein n=1 Tax=Daphnia magna TaxID=35525 RepID=A0ABQ9Z3J7_9CRUS|nr:hypothetical protein OUZ56_012593 [Daphnia magna]